MNCAALPGLPPLGFVPSAELVFVQDLGESGCCVILCFYKVSKILLKKCDLSPLSHTHVQYFAPASRWSRVSVTKNGLCSDLSVSKGQGMRGISSLKTKMHKQCLNLSRILNLSGY